MNTKFTIHDVLERNGQKFVLVSASVGNIVIKKEFPITDNFDKSIIKNELQTLLDKEIKTNNQLEALKAKIGQDL